jgi:hypothetical protein
VFRALAFDAAGNEALIPAVHYWTVDRRIPIIQLVSGPSESSNSPNGSVSFAARGNGAAQDCGNCTAYCSIDNDSPVFCTDRESPSLASLSYSGLSPGPHTAHVSFSNALAVSASFAYSWVADFTSPVPWFVLPPSPVRANPFPVLVSFTEACSGGGGFTCVSLTSCEVAVSGQALPQPESFHPLGELEYSFMLSVIADGPVVISIPPGVCRDAAGNPNSPLNASVYFQAEPPQALLSTTAKPIRIRTGGQGTTSWGTNAAPVSFLVSFTREIAGFNSSGVRVVGGTVRNLVSVTSARFTTSDSSSGPQSGEQSLVSISVNASAAVSFGTAFYFEVWPSGVGPISAQVLADSCTDHIGSPNNASDVLTVLFETSAPTVTLSVTGGSSGILSPFERGSVKILVRFSKPVVVLTNSGGSLEGLGFSAAQLSLKGCSVTEFLPQNDGLSYLVTLVRYENGGVTEGSVWVPAGAVADLAGNPNAESKVLVVKFGEHVCRASQNCQMQPVFWVFSSSSPLNRSIAEINTG